MIPKEKSTDSYMIPDHASIINTSSQPLLLYCNWPYQTAQPESGAFAMWSTLDYGGLSYYGGV